MTVATYAAHGHRLRILAWTGRKRCTVCGRTFTATRHAAAATCIRPAAGSGQSAIRNPKSAIENPPAAAERFDLAVGARNAL